MWFGLQNYQHCLLTSPLQIHQCPFCPLPWLTGRRSLKKRNHQSTCGNCLRMPIRASTRKSPLSMASLTWGACWNVWKRWKPLSPSIARVSLVKQEVKEREEVVGPWKYKLHELRAEILPRGTQRCKTVGKSRQSKGYHETWESRTWWVAHSLILPFCLQLQLSWRGLNLATRWRKARRLSWGVRWSTLTSRSNGWRMARRSNPQPSISQKAQTHERTP